jgi:hypothetical protein
MVKSRRSGPFAEDDADRYNCVLCSSGDLDMSDRLLSRRHFNAACAKFGLSAFPAYTVLTALTDAPARAAGAEPTTAGRSVKFQNGTIVPAIGQGTWHLGQGRHPADIEEAALRLGLSLGLSLIDT